MRQMGLMQQNNDAEMMKQMKLLGMDPAEFGAAAQSAENDPDILELNKFLAREEAKGGGNSEAAMLKQLEQEIMGMGGGKAQQPLIPSMNVLQKIEQLKKQV